MNLTREISFSQDIVAQTGVNFRNLRWEDVNS